MPDDIVIADDITVPLKYVVYGLDWPQAPHRESRSYPLLMRVAYGKFFIDVTLHARDLDQPEQPLSDLMEGSEWSSRRR